MVASYSCGYSVGGDGQCHQHLDQGEFYGPSPNEYIRRSPEALSAVMHRPVDGPCQRRAGLVS